ncbi:hypothetical protein [Actinomycetospora sp.]|jgi:hypothetical protein|uniref:hypothetical protein n=1 Tax=Actinomycetospora sp. TaxID=1872135 RepID=UPI002F4077F9
MSQPTTSQLSDQQRDALTKELFARQQVAEPGSHFCFCGGDRDLIDAVERYRDEQDRERG